jgi:hypothetical protein
MGTNQNTVLKNIVSEAPDSFYVEEEKFPGVFVGV